MRKKLTKHTKHVILSLITIVVLGVAVYVSVFSTKWGFCLLMKPLNNIIDEQNKTPGSDWGNFDYEVYDKKEFCHKYLNSKCKDDLDLIKKLQEKYPPTFIKTGPLTYKHGYETSETITLDQGTKKVKCLLFGLNKYSDFVYVTKRWVHLTENE